LIVSALLLYGGYRLLEGSGLLHPDAHVWMDLAHWWWVVLLFLTGSLAFGWRFRFRPSNELRRARMYGATDSARRDVRAGAIWARAGVNLAKKKHR
jgi:hypothetical protein